MKTLVTASIVALASVASLASAAPVIDGTLTGADGYGVPVKVYAGTDNYVNGNDASGGTNVVSQYFTFDDNYVYGAIHLDSGPSSGFANVYFYSGSANTNTATGMPGSYGDGNDIIAEGTNGWGFATAAGGITPEVPYNAATVNYVTNGIDTAEFSIARSLLGTYSSFRYGGQLFAYEFHTGGDRVDGPIVFVPEPTTLAAIAGGAILLLGRRRRRTA